MLNLVDSPPLSDELILQQLGAAALLCWQQLPHEARVTILDQANDMIGLTPVADARSEIVRLLSRRNVPS